MRNVIPLLVLLCACTSQPLYAEVRLSKVFNDHMVLQRQKPLRIWGTSEVGAKVSVAFAGQTRTTAADAAGKWLVELGPLEASSKGRQLVAKSGTGAVTIEDVLVGEVWITPGQSNMECELSHTTEADIDIAGADYPQIRFFMPVIAQPPGGRG